MFDDQVSILTSTSASWTTPSSVAPPSGRVTPRSKSKGMVQADHSYSKRKMSSESSGQSSQESADVPNNPLPLNLAPPILLPVSTKTLSQGDTSTPVMTSPPKLSKSLPPLNLAVSPSSQHTTGSLIDVANLSVATPGGTAVPPPTSLATQQMSMRRVFNNMISNMIAKHLSSESSPASSLATDPTHLSSAHQIAPAKALPTLPSLAEEQPRNDTAEHTSHSSATDSVCLGRDTPKAADKSSDVDMTEVAPVSCNQTEPECSQKDSDRADLLQATGPDSKVEPTDIISHPVLNPVPSTTPATSGAISPVGGATTGGTPSVAPSVHNDLTPKTVKCEDTKESSMADDVKKSDSSVSACANAVGETESDKKQTKTEPEVNVTVKSEDPETDEKQEDKEGGEGEGKDEPEVEDQVRRGRLMAMCIKAFSLCLGRFPQHYKSLYRLAYIYFHDTDHKVAAYLHIFILLTIWSYYRPFLQHENEE